MLAHPGLISQDEEAVGGSDKGDSPLAHLGRAHGIDEREEVELAPLHGGLASLELDHLAEIASEEADRLDSWPQHRAQLFEAEPPRPPDRGRKESS